MHWLIKVPGVRGMAAHVMSFSGVHRGAVPALRAGLFRGGKRLERLRPLC